MALVIILVKQENNPPVSEASREVANLTERKNLHRGEISVANLIPPVNDPSQGNYILLKI